MFFVATRPFPAASARDETRIPLRRAAEDKLIRAKGFMGSKIFLHGELNLFKEHLLECADVVLFVKEKKSWSLPLQSSPRTQGI